MDQEKSEPRVWCSGAIAGAILTTVIGFGLGGWVTGGTAQEMAENAVVDRLVPICVAQFNGEPKKDQKFKEFQNSKAWKQSNFVKKQGWATMPGEKNPDQEVSDRCVGMIRQSGQ